MPAYSFDSAFSQVLGQSAVHTGMAGCTDLVVGAWNNQVTDVPLVAAVPEPKRVELGGWRWQPVLASTGQLLAMR